MLGGWEIFIHFLDVSQIYESFGVSVCPSVHKEQLGSHWKHFYEISHLSVFRKYFLKILESLKTYKNEYFTWRPTYIYDTTSSVPLIVRKYFQVVQKIKIHFSCSITLWRKSCHLWDNVVKYDMIWYMIWYVWYDVWYDMIYVMIWYMIWYDIWYGMIYDMIRYMIGYMIWYDIYDMIYDIVYDMIYDMIRYDMIWYIC